MTSKVDTRNLTHKQKEQKEKALKRLAEWKMTPEARAHFEDDAYWEESQAEAFAKVNKACNVGAMEMLVRMIRLMKRSI